MVALVQRVSEASVVVDGETTGAINDGLLVLLGVRDGDSEAESEWLANKVANLRVFPDSDGKMDESVLDTGGGVLVVPQFTLYGDVSGGHRPSFTDAASPGPAKELYLDFVDRLSDMLGRPVPTGVFGAMMDVHLTNDGPVTLWIEK
ncbi:D-tyrosyl-tRNA(Tyr) deacylase [Longibacter salinarum]|uniref:D-aminoacyl-tRNA deacylase n=1 Tax=Longibacter salinarum TaxID=1850348 RepID=A0A2A8CU65_9BACT|nr:D-aminoacyl-tRNA deacylase [Longibacter salinarum]PEN11296.1 D-tyrosyl-tRNA(Tyr) deacylase [Longibacter salinarum]